MLQPKIPSLESNHNGNNPPPREYVNGIPAIGNPAPTSGVDIQHELNQLEEIVLSSLRIPLTGRTLIDEDKLLEQLDFVRLSLPTVFQEALNILAQKNEILLEAEEYGQQVVDVAQAKRAQILAESDIVRQAQREADQLRRQVQQDCEAMMQDTLAEIDRKRRACQQELEEMRQVAISQAEEIEDGADKYADNVLANIEQDIQEMLKIITNGRKQLNSPSVPKNGDHPQQRPHNSKKR
ncbi:DivIVA domain-containing protein [Aphanizomenon sp. CS-733/32]|uniref:DivIVA domain-containing protein n=1 Tax=Aphanizomenon sp. CS-733/32 TaxID=3021715 RepID=UPI00232B66E8|nr:DivIVA domain-containing protein [Aphanizomenon sp. CS-733/32]MDB9309117.1 DivIVA domain-containing protein [Aphanizomenon sp. CS-733/32]